jgi:hypothetical protein
MRLSSYDSSKIKVTYELYQGHVRHQGSGCTASDEDDIAVIMAQVRGASNCPQMLGPAATTSWDYSVDVSTSGNLTSTTVIVTSGVVTYTSAQGATTTINAGQAQTFQGYAATQAQFTQQGPKLVDTSASRNSHQGVSIALSGDGNTAVVGGPGDNPPPNGNSDVGAAWVYTRTGSVWTQQAKLMGSTSAGNADQGWSAALSADGNTAIVGGPGDSAGIGAAWVWTRGGSAWTQQAKLVGAGVLGGTAHQGASVALSGDGNTAIVGGPQDNADPNGGPGTGAAWVFTRSGSAWTQQAKLVGSGAVGYAGQGSSVALSRDGSTAIVGGPSDSTDTSGFSVGAAWVFTLSAGAWSPQGGKLLGNDSVYAGQGVQQGTSVALSGDGNTAIVGGPSDNSTVGAAWIWSRSGSAWTQQGSKLVTDPGDFLGNSVSLSCDGNTAIAGGPGDNSGAGAAWVWNRSGGGWTPQGLVGSAPEKRAPRARASSSAGQEGYSVALSGDGNTAIVGGPGDNGYGSTWVFVRMPPQPTSIACVQRAQPAPIAAFHALLGRYERIFHPAR